jgi:hypothetical protein
LEQLLIQAIANKNLVEFWYGDHHRITEPHVLGVSGGVVQLLGYQLRGTSNSGGIPEWRRVDLHKMSLLNVLPETFGGRRPFPSGKHSDWDRVIVVVGE